MTIDLVLTIPEESAGLTAALLDDEALEGEHFEREAAPAGNVRIIVCVTETNRDSLLALLAEYGAFASIRIEHGGDRIKAGSQSELCAYLDSVLS